MTSTDPSPALPPVAGDESKLKTAKHVTYWKRCLKTYLPTYYTSNDLNRMMLAFFIVSALDVLDALHTGTTADEREGYVDWVYRCQHPAGGFRGAPATDLGERANEHNQAWDPASVPATYFALSILVILGDDLGRVRRKDCLRWLTRMQRPDGSFGETLGEHGKIEGGQDPRFGYCATAIRWMLRGDVEGPVDGVPDIDVDGLVRCVRSSETYDGGISEAPYHEPHAGYTYCALSLLSFIDRLPPPFCRKPRDEQARKLTALQNPSLTLHWLASRQTATLSADDSFDTASDETDTPATCHDAHTFVAPSAPLSANAKASIAAAPTSRFALRWAGFNGRCNKIADTCYAFWTLGSLDALGQTATAVVDGPAARRYLLDRTQHLVGGFGKLPGDPPDIYHSYLGLAALAILSEPGLKRFDAPLCFSRDAKEWLEGLSWRREIVGSAS